MKSLYLSATSKFSLTMIIDLYDTLIELTKSVRQYQTHKMKEKKETDCNCRHAGQILLYFVEPGHIIS